MSEVVQSGGNRGHKGKKRARRMGIRMDMTPMVDVAFLLLTFFMLATTLTTPQVMEISLPQDKNAKVDMAESNLLTLRVRKDQAIFWNVASDPPKKITEAQLRGVLAGELAKNPKLATFIKIDRDAKYQALVDMVDELNLALSDRHLNEKRFSIVTMDDKDQQLVSSL